LKSRYLRGLKSGDGNSDGEQPEYPPPMNTTYQAAANDTAAAEQPAAKASRSWPFAYALGLALLASAVLWAVIAGLIRYF